MADLFAESLRAFLKPIGPFLDDPDVSEVMVNGPTDIWIEKKGKLIKTEARFTEEGVNAAARNMAQFVGRPLSDERPRLDARLPDGSRIHVVLAPIARKGTTISIRKFFKDKLTIEKLIEFGSMTAEMAHFIDACVIMKENMVVSGGTGSGKTTLLNVLAQFIPNDERVLTIEDSAELQLNQEHLVPFESRPPDKLGKGGVDMGDLLHSALRLRPDRIVVGEVRGGECFHLLQAMNTGHGGSLATTHANTPVDTLRRLESLALMSGIELPMIAVRAQVASAINIITCCERFQDGSRRTTHVAEVLPLDDRGEYRTQDIFVFTPTRKDENGRIQGYHAPTGALPTFLSRMSAYGFGDIDENYFDPIARGLPPPAVHTEGNFRVRWVPRFRHRERGEADPQSLVDSFPKEAPPRPTAGAAPKPAAAAAPPPAPKPAAQATPRPPPPPAAPTPRPAVRPPASSQDDRKAAGASGLRPTPRPAPGGVPPAGRPAGSRPPPSVLLDSLEQLEGPDGDESEQGPVEKTALHPVPTPDDFSEE